MATTVPATRSDWAEERLRQAILRGDLEPGQRLHANDLAASWSVSATPLREAFQRLAGDGLVEVLPQRGARVAQLSADDVAGIYELRLLLEPVALRQSLDVSDDDHRAEIRAAFAAFRSSRDVHDGLEAHGALHAALLARCPSPWMLRFIAQLTDASRLFQVTSITSGPAHRHPVREHRAIVDAAVAGDVDGCVTLHEQHLRTTLDRIASSRPEDRPVA